MTHLFSAGMEYQEQDGSPYLRQPKNTQNMWNSSFKGIAHQVMKDRDSFPEIWEINEVKPAVAGLLQFCESFQAMALRREPRRRPAASLSRGDRVDCPQRPKQLEFTRQMMVEWMNIHCFSRIWISATLWTVVHQITLSLVFSRQEYWSGLPCLPPESLPNPGIEPTSLMFATLVGRFFTTSTIW